MKLLQVTAAAARRKGEAHATVRDRGDAGGDLIDGRAPRYALEGTVFAAAKWMLESPVVTSSCRSIPHGVV